MDLLEVKQYTCRSTFTFKVVFDLLEVIMHKEDPLASIFDFLRNIFYIFAT